MYHTMRKDLRANLKWDEHCWSRQDFSHKWDRQSHLHTFPKGMCCRALGAQEAEAGALGRITQGSRPASTTVRPYLKRQTKKYVLIKQSFARQGKQNLGHRGSSTSAQLCDDLKEMPQRNSRPKDKTSTILEGTTTIDQGGLPQERNETHVF